jgi:hypothetical protein
MREEIQQHMNTCEAKISGDIERVFCEEYDTKKAAILKDLSDQITTASNQVLAETKDGGMQAIERMSDDQIFQCKKSQFIQQRVNDAKAKFVTKVRQVYADSERAIPIIVTGQRTALEVQVNAFFVDAISDKQRAAATLQKEKDERERRAAVAREWAEKRRREEEVRKRTYPQNAKEWLDCHESAVSNPFGQEITLFKGTKPMKFILTSRDELTLPGMVAYMSKYHITFSPDNTRCYNLDKYTDTEKDVSPSVDPITLQVVFKSPVTVVGGHLIRIILPKTFRISDAFSGGYQIFTDGSYFSVEMGDHSSGPRVEPA